MFKKTLIVIAVLSAMPNGYRRAGFSLNKGDNSPLEVNQEQLDLLTADKNLTVSVLGADLAQGDVNTHVKSERILAANVEQLRNENALLQSKVQQLTEICATYEETITLLEIEIANPPVYTHEDTLHSLADSVETTTILNDLDVSSAPQELHHWIAVIDDLNKEAPLTKKPNCDHLTVTADGEDITPTGAERDAAWAWYQENIVVTSTASLAGVNIGEIGKIDTREAGE